MVVHVTVGTSENLKTLKDIIKNWNGSTCNCRD